MGDQAGEAATLADMGLAHMTNEQTELALAEYKQALDIMSEIGERDGEARTRVRMATLYRSTNQPAQALELLEQALQVSREQGNEANEAFALADSGSLLHDDLNQSVEGISRIKQAIVLFKTYHLSQTLGGQTRDQLQALLAEMQGQSDGVPAQLEPEEQQEQSAHGLMQLEPQEQQEQATSDSVQLESQEQTKTGLKTPVIASRCS